MDRIYPSKMKNLISTQSDFFDTNKTKKVAFRISQLKKLQKIIRGNEQEFHNAIYKDFKKSEFENYTAELMLILHDIGEAIHKVKRRSKRKK